MKINMLCTMGLGAVIVFSAGCNKQANSDMNYKSAINDHFKSAPVCIWPESKKLPAQETTSDDAKTEGYDALTQAGLLVRTTAEKKVFIIASKQVNNYDLSDTGRSTWTPDPNQPGYGNFCYGHREVTSIDNSTVGTNASGAKTATISYHYKVAGVPGWATTPQMETAFPAISTAVSSTPVAAGHADQQRRPVDLLLRPVGPRSVDAAAWLHPRVFLLVRAFRN